MKLKQSKFPCSRAARQQTGFSLIEVLAALLVLSIGLLGLAGLQTFSFKMNNQSYQRTQATLLISDMIDRMRGNPSDTLASAYNLPLLTSTAPTYTTNCGSTACTAAGTMANYDMNKWITTITQRSMLPGGQGQIVPGAPIAAAGGTPAQLTYAITVSWTENDLTMRQTETVLLP